MVASFKMMTIADPWINLDGRLDAPIGTPQYPALLNGYHDGGVADSRYYWPSTMAFNGSTSKYYQPQWHVPGVDYAVGINPGVTLQDPTTISISGVSVNSGTHTVTVNTGANGATISGIDFSLDNGWQVVISASNITLTDCYFASGSNISGFLSVLNGDNNNNTNLTVKYCHFNGLDTTGSLSSVIGNIRGATFLYCLIENSNQDLVDFGGSGATYVPIVFKYCVFHNDGAASSHADWLQVGGATYNVTILFCLSYHTGGAGSGSQGWFVDPGNGGTVVGFNEYGYNVFVLGSGANVNFCCGLQFTLGSGNSAIVHDSFADLTGNNNAFGKTYGTGTATYTNNVSMLSGAEIPGF